jgi:elongation factor P hydroxylase
MNRPTLSVLITKLYLLTAILPALCMKYHIGVWQVKSGALEWLFSISSKRVYVVSADNLAGEECDDLAFRLAVSAQARDYFTHGLPPQAALLLSQLKQTYKGQVTLDQLYWPEEQPTSAA